MKNYIIFILMLVSIDGYAQVSNIAKQKCEKLIIQRWDRHGTDKYGRQFNQTVNWIDDGPYGPGKYMDNSFYVFNLVINNENESHFIELSVDCIFDETGKVLGIEVRDD